MGWIIDGHGKAWARGADPIARSCSDADPLNCAITELGFVHVRPCRSGIGIRLNPFRLQPLAMVGAFYVVADLQPSRVLVSHGNDAAAFGRPRDALRYVEQLADQGRAEALNYRSRPLSPEDLPIPLAEGLRAWRDRAGRWTAELRERLFAAGHLRDAVITREDGNRRRFVNEYCGPRHDLFGPHWPRAAAKLDFGFHPIPELRGRLSTLFRAVLARNEPAPAHVAFSVSAPDGTPIRADYDRLALPWTTPDGNRRITYLTAR